MTVLAYESQGCYSSVSCSRITRKGVRSKPSVYFNHTRTCKLVSSCSSHTILSRKRKGCKVCSLKGSFCNEAEGTLRRWSRSSKNCICLSFLPNREREEEVLLAESPDENINPVTVDSVDSNNSASGSPLVKNLFKKLLTLLWRRKYSVAIVEPHSRRSKKIARMDDPGVKLYRYQTRKLLMAAVLRFWLLDATIKFPLLIFPTFYLAVRLAHGVEVVKELTPLWVLGPLIFSLYIVLIRWIVSCYVLCFKLSVKFIINLSRCYSYLREGKLKAYLRSHLWQPICEDIKNMDYKELWIQKLNQLMEWAKDKRLDLLESLWPFYCRTIIFLKRANLI